MATGTTNVGTGPHLTGNPLLNEAREKLSCISKCKEMQH